MVMAQKIRVRINTAKPHLYFANDAQKIYACLKDNPAYPDDSPVALDVFKKKIDEYFASISAATDGSRKSMADRNRLKDEVETMMWRLGHWVEANCKQDPA